MILGLFILLMTLLLLLIMLRILLFLAQFIQGVGPGPDISPAATTKSSVQFDQAVCKVIWTADVRSREVSAFSVGVERP